MALNAYLTLGHSGVAKELDTTVARVVLAWVQGQPGVASTIIGARAVEQFENNLGALKVKPAGFLRGAPTFMHGGLTVNGITAPPFPLGPRSDKDRW